MAAGFCSWKAAVKNLAGSACENQPFESMTGDWSDIKPKESSIFQPHRCFIQAFCFTQTQSFLPSFSVTRESSAKTPLPALCWEQDDRAKSDLQWHGMITAFSKIVSTRCLALQQARSLSNIHGVFHTVIHHPAQEVQDARHFPYWAAKNQKVYLSNS